MLRLLVQVSVLKQKLQAKHYLTEDYVTIEPIEGASQFTEHDVKDIVTICNQTHIYQKLFQKMTDGEPYVEKNAYGWLRYAEEGWTQGKYFIYIIRQEGSIVGAIDIKSDNIDFGEIGYWMSETTKGFMTNVVIELCKTAQLASFKTMAAFVEMQSLNSKRVLDRAKFSTISIQTVDGKKYYRMELRRSLI